MKNIPKTICLQIGEQVDKAEAIDFNQLSGVTWSVSKCFKNDLEYIYYPFAQGAIEAAKAEAYSEAQKHYENRLKGEEVNYNIKAKYADKYYNKTIEQKEKIKELQDEIKILKSKMKSSWINRLFNKKGD